jgi:cytoskeletal protein CcmA (bactofilin family)
MNDPSPIPSTGLSVARKATIEGSLDFPGPVVIDGTILGDVRCTSLIVTDRGVVDGAIRKE